MEDRAVDLTDFTLDPAIGGTILKSSRVNILKAENGPRRALKNLSKAGIDGLIVAGGEDTLSNAFALGDFPRVLIAKTIDNDVGRMEGGPKFGPDGVLNYFTLGFPTAAGKIAAFVSLREGLRTTAYSHERIVVVESMGMHAGWLALASGLGGPDFIIIPEFPLDTGALLEAVGKKYEKRRHIIIVVAEGARWEDGSHLRVSEDEGQGFDHPRFGGAAEVLKDWLQKGLSGRIETRNVNAVNPSYLYRSGAPNGLDREWAEKLGIAAAELLLQGDGEPAFLAIQREGKAFSERAFSLSNFRSSHDLHRFVDGRFYNPEAFQITGEGLEYLRAIEKEIPLPERYGLEEGSAKAVTD